MSGIAFVVDAAFQRGIVVRNDIRISSGTILLIEPARDGPDGIPSSLRNYARDEFLESSGIDVPSITCVDTLSAVAGCLVERTSKGGIHGVVATDAFGSHSGRFRFAAVTPTTVLQYIVDNPDHSYYFGMIGRVTRNAATSANTVGLGGIAPIDGEDQSTTSVIGVAQAVSNQNILGRPATTNNYFINRRTVPGDGVPYFCDSAVSGHQVPNVETFSTARAEFFTMGERSASSTASGHPSHIVYSCWLEDLTVSGRSYSEASAEGLAVFNERFAQGGRYDGDTWTPPEDVT